MLFMSGYLLRSSSKPTDEALQDFQHRVVVVAKFGHVNVDSGVREPIFIVRYPLVNKSGLAHFTPTIHQDSRARVIVDQLRKPVEQLFAINEVARRSRNVNWVMFSRWVFNH